MPFLLELCFRDLSGKRAVQRPWQGEDRYLLASSFSRTDQKSSQRPNLLNSVVFYVELVQGMNEIREVACH